MSSPFEYVKSIFSHTDIMIDDIEEKSYNSFMVNRTLSEYPDTILLANEMNIYHQLDNRLKYSFLLNTIRKGNRKFSKWTKANSHEDIEVVKEYYGYSNEKASMALALLDKDQINELRLRTYKGGTTTTRTRKL